MFKLDKKDMDDLIKRTKRPNWNKISFDYVLPGEEYAHSKTKTGKPRWFFELQEKGGVPAWINRVNFLEKYQKDKDKEARSQEKVQQLKKLVGLVDEGNQQPAPAPSGFSTPSSISPGPSARGSLASFLSELASGSSQGSASSRASSMSSAGASQGSASSMSSAGASQGLLSGIPSAGSAFNPIRRPGSETIRRPGSAFSPSSSISSTGASQGSGGIIGTPLSMSPGPSARGSNVSFISSSSPPQLTQPVEDFDQMTQPQGPIVREPSPKEPVVRQPKPEEEEEEEGIVIEMPKPRSEEDQKKVNFIREIDRKTRDYEENDRSAKDINEYLNQKKELMKEVKKSVETRLRNNNLAQGKANYYSIMKFMEDTGIESPMEAFDELKRLEFDFIESAPQTLTTSKKSGWQKRESR